MSATIPASHIDLLQQPVVVTLTTIAENGDPYSVVVWKRWDGEHIRITSDAGVRKHRNIQANARVSVLALDPDNTQRYLSLGCVVEEIVATGVVEELDRQTLHFTGHEHYFGVHEPKENEATFDGVFFKIKPVRAVAFG
jgi:nitroimidazol reductase NimA-like FMN-containing flavoprotein (pyridoxamine 5'-phosphate oxidase superfamily)